MILSNVMCGLRMPLALIISKAWTLRSETSSGLVGFVYGIVNVSFFVNLVLHYEHYLMTTGKRKSHAIHESDSGLGRRCAPGRRVRLRCSTPRRNQTPP